MAPMSKEMTLIVLGLLTAVLPFLGFPGSWRTVLFVLMGLAVAVIGFLLRARALARGDEAGMRQTYTESEPRRSMDGMRYAHEEGGEA